MHRTSRKLVQALFELLPVCLARRLHAGNPDDGERRSQEASSGKIIKCRDQQPVSQIPRGAENDESAGVGNPYRGFCAIRAHASPALRSTCPPNPLRMAERSFSANVWSSRERKRA